MGTIELNTCDVCHSKDVEVKRKYYYTDIDCECCSKDHFEYVSHCSECKPSPPLTANIVLNPNKFTTDDEKPAKAKIDVRRVEVVANDMHNGLFHCTGCEGDYLPIGGIHLCPRCDFGRS